jgi:hypothetical protein
VANTSSGGVSWVSFGTRYLEGQKAGRHQLDFFVADSLWNTYQLSQIPNQLFIPSQNLTVKLRNKKSFKKGEQFKLRYLGEPIDSTILYCSGTHYIDETSAKSKMEVVRKIMRIIVLASGSSPCRRVNGSVLLLMRWIQKVISTLSIWRTGSRLYLSGFLQI